MNIKGRAIVVGDDINTDGIIAGRYLHLTNPDDLASHVMENADIEFNKKYRKGDIIVAGKNFGCGSSREQAAMSLRYKGVKTIIAISFARIFYRNAINQGIFPIESLQSYASIFEYDELEIDIAGGYIYNITKNIKINFIPFPSFIQDIIRNDGLVPYLQQNKIVMGLTDEKDS
ncbi:MAG: 3-isopropylmalate dehydratase [Thermoplasmatota archaeon]